MSRIGKLPISIPSGVEISIENNLVKVKGPKGELEKQIDQSMKIEIKDNVLTITRPNESKKSKSLHGLYRTLIFNMVEGVTNGYQKKLEIVGVGYRAQANGSNKITLNLGYSHPIVYEAAQGVKFEMDKDNKNMIVVSGINKEEVGQAAAKVRSFRKPEPYKGKGIKYENEYIIRKAGKAAAK